jgi:acyl-coenzyme A synthetase/AMP-(fatty) acid ligase/WD40 repeat protein/thioesterase domain-containing protein
MRESVTSIFESFAATSPAYTALEIMDERKNIRAFSYGEINEKANRLAHYLVAQGCTKGDIIAIAIAKSEDLYISNLAVWKIGAILAHVSMTLEQQEAIDLVANIGCKYLITTHSVLEKALLDNFELKIFNLNNLSLSLASFKSTNLQDVVIELSDPSYIVFTSGTTGKPKGILSRNYLHTRALFQIKRSRLINNAKVIQLSDPRVDVFLMNLATAWCAGWALCDTQLPVDELMFDLPKVFHKFAINYAICPPTLLENLLDNKTLAEQNKMLSVDFAALTELVSATEALKPETVKSWEFRGESRSKRRIGNGFGATEECVGSTFTDIPIQRDQVIIGNIHKDVFPDLRLFVLRDEQLWLLGEGELVTTGASIMVGYWNNGKLNKDVFLEKSDPENPLQKIFIRRTGDKISIDTEGYMYFQGRINLDRQLEIAGTRIEPAPIENKLETHPSIEKAILTKYKRRLVAYLVLNEQAAPPMPTQLRQLISQRKNYNKADVPLSYYIISKTQIPAAEKDALDMASLPNLSAIIGDEQKAEHAIEEQIKLIWEKGFGYSPISVTDGFYAVGGYSLLLKEIFAEINHTLFVDLQLKDFNIEEEDPITIRKMATRARLQKIYSQSWLVLSEAEKTPDLLQVFLPPLAGGTNRKYKELTQAIASKVPMVAVRSISLRVPMLNNDLSEEDRDWFLANMAPNLNEMGNYIGRTLNQLNTSNCPVVLVGWSFGGMLGHAAAPYINNVSSLITLDSMPPGQSQLIPTKEFADRIIYIINKVAESNGMEDGVPTFKYSTKSLSHQEIANDLFSKVIDSPTPLNQSFETWRYFQRRMQTALFHLLASINYQPIHQLAKIYSYIATDLGDSPIAEGKLDGWRSFAKDVGEIILYNTSHHNILDKEEFVTSIARLLQLQGISAQHDSFILRLYQAYQQRQAQQNTLAKVNTHPFSIVHQGEQIDLTKLAVKICTAGGEVTVLQGLTGVGKSVLSDQLEEELWQKRISGASNMIPLRIDIQDLFINDLEHTIDVTIRSRYRCTEEYKRESLSFVFICDDFYLLTGEAIDRLERFFSRSNDSICIFTRGNHLPKAYSLTHQESYYSILPLRQEQLMQLISSHFSEPKASVLKKMVARYPALSELLCMPLFMHLIKSDDITNEVEPTTLSRIMEAICYNSYNCNLPEGMMYKELEKYNHQLAFLNFVNKEDRLIFDYNFREQVQDNRGEVDPKKYLLKSQDEVIRSLRRHSFLVSYDAETHYFPKIVQYYLSAKYIISLARDYFAKIPDFFHDLFEELTQNTQLLFVDPILQNFLETQLKPDQKFIVSLMQFASKTQNEAPAAHRAFALSLLAAARASLADWGIENAKISDAVLCGIDLIGTGMNGASFTNCDFRNALWSDAILINTKFENCQFSFNHVPGNYPDLQHIFPYGRGKHFITVHNRCLSSQSYLGEKISEVIMAEQIITAATVSPRSLHMAVAYNNGTVLLYDMLKFKLMGKINFITAMEKIISLDYASNGEKIIALLSSDQVVIFSAWGNTLYKTFSSITGQKIKFIRNAADFLVSNNQYIHVYNASGLLAQSILFNAQILSYTLSPDENYLIVTTDDGYLHSYNFQYHERTKKYIGDILATAIVFKPQSQQFCIAISTSTILEFSSRDLALISSQSCFGGTIKQLSFMNEEGKLLVYFDSGKIFIWDWPGMHLPHLDPAPLYVKQRAIAGNDDATAYLTQDISGQVWLGFTEYVFATPLVNCDTILAYAPWRDGYSMCVLTAKGLYKINNEASLTPIPAFILPGDRQILTGTFSKNNFLVAYLTNRHLSCFNIQSQQHVFHRVISLENRSECSIQFSPQGSILSIADGSSLYVCETQEGKVLYSSFGQHAIVAFHPKLENKLLVSDNQALVLWNLDTKECENYFIGHDYQITAINYHIEGKYIVSGDANGYALLWDESKSEPLRSFSSQSQAIRNIIFREYIELPSTKDNKIVLFAENSSVLWRHQPYNKQNVYSYVHSNLVTRADNVRIAPQSVEPVERTGNFQKAKSSLQLQFFKSKPGADYFKKRYKRPLGIGQIEIEGLKLSAMNEREQNEFIKMFKQRYQDEEVTPSRVGSPGLFDSNVDFMQLLRQLVQNNDPNYLDQESDDDNSPRSSK